MFILRNLFIVFLGIMSVSVFGMEIAKDSYIGLSVTNTAPSSLYRIGWDEGKVACEPDIAGCTGAENGLVWAYEHEYQWMNPGLEVRFGLNLNQNVRTDLSFDGTFFLQESKNTIGTYYNNKSGTSPLPEKSFWETSIDTGSPEQDLNSLTKIKNDKDFVGRSVQSSFENLRVMNALVNVYYVFPGHLSPYVGVGLGYGLVHVKDEYKSSYERNPDKYNTHQATDILKGTLSKRITVGIECDGHGRMIYGIRAQYTHLNEIALNGLPYVTRPAENHPTSTTLLKSIDYATVAVSVKYPF